MIHVREANPEDAFAMGHREATAKEIAIQSLEDASFTILRDNFPIGMMGFHMDMPGVYSVWASFDEKVRGNGVQLTKTVRRVMRTVAAEVKAVRVQLIVDPDRMEFVRWARLLGFEVEGYMRLGMAGVKDAILMAWIPGDENVIKKAKSS